MFLLIDILVIELFHRHFHFRSFGEVQDGIYTHTHINFFGLVMENSERIVSNYTLLPTKSKLIILVEKEKIFGDQSVL